MARLELDSLHGSVAGDRMMCEEAFLELGLQYSTGRGVEPDLVAAHKWFNLAALQGSAEARRYRSEIAREMSRAEIARAQREAREWLHRR